MKHSLLQKAAAAALFVLLTAALLAAADFLLIGLIFGRIRHNERLIHVACHQRDFFVVDRVKYIFICFVQCGQINKTFRSQSPILCWF